jgi:hypothetical protein
MSCRSAYALVAGLTLALALQVGTSASSTRHGNDDVEVVVGGHPLQRYAHGERWYVEAIKGREYAIRIRNPYPVRVAVALSVDGLNTIDARQTTAAHARKWVLDPYETITISGWQTSQSQARRFEFTTEERSYGQALGKTENLGIITAVFFKERMMHTMLNQSLDARTRSQAPPPAPAAGAGNEQRADSEYAATGMGRRTDHHVTQVWLDLEDRPSHTVNIRYEFRPQLVRLGVLPHGRVVDPLKRREKATGFAPGFCPEPPRQ